MAPKRTPVEVRVWSRIRKTENPDECWLWIGARNGENYGQLKIGRYRKVMSHRVVWAQANNIPLALCDDKIIRHTCDTPLCCNPRHLIEGTHADNVADRVKRGRSARGIRNGRAKLNPVAVAQIRRRYDTGKFAMSVLARQFGVSEKAIHNAIRRKHWRDVS